MSSDKKSDQSSSSGTPKPPKPPLPGEDPNLIFTISSRVEGTVQNVNVAGGDVVAGEKSAESPAEAQERYKRKAKRYAVGLWLGLIGFGILFYFILQYFFR